MTYIKLYKVLYVSKLCIPISRRGVGVVANMLDLDILVSEFELESFLYVHFRTDIPGKDFILKLCLNSTTAVLP